MVVHDEESVIAAGIESAACDRIVRCCGLSRSELMTRAGLDEQLPLTAAPHQDSRVGSTFQIFSQYSRTERSDEKYPMRATLRIARRDQSSA
jgi:hypothetical protein